MDKASKKLKILTKRLQLASDPNRLKILCLIFKVKKICVTDVASKLDLNIGITSHHLQALEKEGLLQTEREGKMACYSLSNTSFMEDLKKFICKYK